MFVYISMWIYVLGICFVYMNKRHQCMLAFVNIYMHVHVFVCDA